jgi:peptidyl-prolyl cis-trans isomerase SurA
MSASAFPFEPTSRRPGFVKACLCAGALLLASLPLQAPAQSLRLSPSLSLLNANQDTRQRSADFIVAVVNSEPITNHQVRNRVLQVEQQYSARGAALPPRGELYAQVLERLIAERTQIQLARDYGIRVDEATLDGAVANIARQNQLSMEQFRQRLREDGIDMAALRSSLRDELLLQRIREREVEPRVRVTDAELDAFIREQRDTSAGDLEINLAQILVAVPENASEAQVAALQAKAQRAFERAKAGEDFAALARELSDAADRTNGGQLGLRPADRYPNLFVETTANVPAGGVAPPVRSGAGFHVLKVITKGQPGLGNLTVAQTRARHILLRTGAQLSESVARERLLELRKRIVAGLDFAAAAREQSQDGSAREGGDLGWAVAGQFVPEFEDVMNSLAPGQVSEPVTTRFGVHLIQVQERRERKMNEREQREAARAALREKKLDEAFVTWAQELRARAYVEYREQPLASQ